MNSAHVQGNSSLNANSQGFAFFSSLTGIMMKNSCEFPIEVV